MQPVLLTTDPVLLSFAEAVLADAQIAAIVADQYTSSIEGSVGIFPRRLCVAARDWHRAWRALEEAGLADNLIKSDDR
jgi:Putative prokaryotic signal transducing protein